MPQYGFRYASRYVPQFGSQYGSLPGKPIDPNDPNLYGGWSSDDGGNVAGPGVSQGTNMSQNFSNYGQALGALGIGIGAVTGVPGLGVLGAAAGTKADVNQARGLYTNYNNPISYKDALESNLTFGKFGRSPYDQTWKNVDPASEGWSDLSKSTIGDPQGINQPTVTGRMYATNQTQGRDYSIGSQSDADFAGQDQQSQEDAQMAEDVIGDVDGEGGGGGGGGWVICTYLVDNKLMDPDLYYTSANHVEHMSPITLRGYRWWAVPFVRLMRKHKWIGPAVAPIAEARAKSIDGGSGLGGKLIRWIGEPLCWTIGLFVEDHDWESLYDGV